MAYDHQPEQAHFGVAELDDDPPSRVSVPAASCAAPDVVAPRSVFELAERPVVVRMRPAIPPPLRPVAPMRLNVDGTGATRIVGAQYPANRWTAEREEQERERRARQRPPRPSKQRFKLRNSVQWEKGGTAE